jgi:hypothetical protein
MCDEDVEYLAQTNVCRAVETTTAYNIRILEVILWILLVSRWHNDDSDIPKVVDVCGYVNRL